MWLDHRTTRRRILLASGLPLLFRPAGAAVVSATTYDLIDIGTLNADGSCYPTGISSNGNVCGKSGFPFVWSSGSGMEALSTGGGTGSAVDANGVNASRTAAGTDFRNLGGANAVIWPAAGSLVKIAAGRAAAINDFGSVTGYFVSKGSTQVLLARMVSGRMKTWGLGAGQGVAISPAGLIAGFTGVSQTAAGFLWTPGVPNGSAGARQPVALGSGYTQPSGVNDTGQVVGTAGGIGPQSRAFLWQGGSGISLGTVPGDPMYAEYEESSASGINSLGQVVGQSRSIDPTNTNNWIEKAFIWDSVGGMRDLNTLIPDYPGFALVRAVGINDAGQIVCRARSAGLDRGVILSPRL